MTVFVQLDPRALALAFVAALASAPVGDALAVEASGSVRVRILVDRQQVRVTDAAGDSVRIVAGKAGLSVDGRSVGASWHSGDNGPFRVETGSGSAKLAVRGRLALHRSAAGLSVINEVSLENYVVGTLGGEMISSWEPAALEAQAVACRSYALYRRARRVGERFDLAADVSSQRYLGVRGESDAAWAAVRATTGVIISYDQRPALTVFHSASGGRTASAQEVWGTSIPYLRSLPVADEDDSPDTYWRAVVSDENLARALAQFGHPIGALEAVEVVTRSGSGRVGRLRFRGAQGRATVSGRELRQLLGSATIKSTLFEVRREAGAVAFVGSGRGHGVGMSQWAAQAMAQEGASYREILENFYPGTNLVTLADPRPRFAKLPAVSLSGRRGRGEASSRSRSEMIGEPSR